MGPSGGGKSTVIKLILRVYEPSDGTICYGNTAIADMPMADWRQRIAYMAQDAYLFSGSILDNIRMGDPHATEREVMEAAMAAHIHHVVAAMPDGYHTRIGERGASLSGGERQRIAIARTVLRNPEILLLDEPTSALDSESEQAVQQALRELMRGRTTLLVAHRLSTVREADKIIYIEHGCMQEEGTHDQLLAAHGRYWDLYHAGQYLDGRTESAQGGMDHGFAVVASE